MSQSTPADVTMLDIKKVRADGGTQSRAELSADIAGGYAEDLKEGAVFPPVIVYFDGSHWWLADGFHRYHAHLQAGRSHIEAIVKPGSKRDAILHSVGSNHTHGLHRTRKDKYHAVGLLLKDEEWCHWSDNKIAKLCGVSNHFIPAVRQKLGLLQVPERTYQHASGTISTMNTAAIGTNQGGVGAKVKEEEDEDPDSGLNEDIEESGEIEWDEEPPVPQRVQPDLSQAVTTDNVEITPGKVRDLPRDDPEDLETLEAATLRAMRKALRHVRRWAQLKELSPTQAWQRWTREALRIEDGSRQRD